MEQLILALTCLAGMLFLLCLGVPVAIAMIASSFVGLTLSAGMDFALTNFMTLPYAAASSFNFAAIHPLSGSFCFPNNALNSRSSLSHHFISRVASRQL
jgi:hypothetical protein